MAGAIQILNYTAHTIVVYEIEKGGAVVAEYPSMGQARVELHRYFGRIAGTSVMLSTFGAATGLPDPRPGTLYLVSRNVERACPYRDDLLVPGEPVRDGKGAIIGCRGLSKRERMIRRAGQIVGCRGLSLTERRMTNDGPAAT